jgi:hypothetical protein
MYKEISKYLIKKGEFDDAELLTQLKSNRFIKDKDIENLYPINFEKSEKGFIFTGNNTIGLFSDNDSKLLFKILTEYVNQKKSNRSEIKCSNYPFKLKI